MRYCNGVGQKGLVDCDAENGQCEICYMADLEDEADSLRADAARYRWMKANVRNGQFGTDTGWIDDDTEHWDDDLELKMGITQLK